MEKLYRAEKAKFLGLKNLGLGGPPGSALEMPLVNPGQQLKKSVPVYKSGKWKVN